MRVHLATALLTLAVLLGAAGAHAEGPGELAPGRCMDRPMVVESASIASRLLSDAGKTSAKQAEALASTVRTEAPSVLPTGQPAGVQVPRQSRAPVMCSDPSQPGCHVDVPDAPSHQGWSATLSNSGDVSLPSDVIPPPGSVAFHWAPHPDGGPYAAHGRLPWRPPAV